MDVHGYFLYERQTSKAHSFDEFQEEGAVFYDELRRQVLQLTTEDDDGDEDANKNKILNTKGAREHGLCSIPQARWYHDWPWNKEDSAAAAPAWTLNLCRSGNGTGVFIPQIVQSRRRKGLRRKNERASTTYKRVERAS